MGSQRPTPSTGHVDVFRLDKRNQPAKERGLHEFSYEYPPRIPVAMRHPYPRVNSVKQYTTDRQHEQLKQHIVSESFIPVSPEAAEKPTRRSRRRPPFSYSSLIAQAILTTANKRMTLRDIYRWIMEKYPALYNADDTGWQNTIRHNLSLNKCFKKVPKSEITPEENRGKGGFWTLDPEYMNQYTDGAFARGSIANRRSMKNPSQPSKSGPGSDSEVSHIDALQYDTHHIDVDPFTSSPPFRRTSPFKPDDSSHYYPTEESDISSNTPSPSMLRMSPVTPPRSSVTIKLSTTDRGTAVNTVHNTTTPLDEQTVVNLDVQQTRLNREDPQDNFLSTILHPSKEEDPFSKPAQDDDPLHTSTVMRIDNILN
ncbi:fork head domain-containing protein [Umbelopsis sp. AD052]|nr:fork head domain-containing protein [Umbelopsis sp. AD052]